MKYFPIFLLLSLLIVPNFIFSRASTEPTTKQKQQEELAVAIKCRLLKDIANLDQTNRLKITRLMSRLKIQKNNPLLTPEDVAWLDKHLLSITAMLSDHDQQKAADSAVSELVESAQVQAEPHLATEPTCTEVTPVVTEFHAQLENQLLTQDTPATELAIPSHLSFIPAVEGIHSADLLPQEIELRLEPAVAEQRASESNQTRSPEVTYTE